MKVRKHAPSQGAPSNQYSVLINESDIISNSNSPQKEREKQHENQPLLQDPTEMPTQSTMDLICNARPNLATSPTQAAVKSKLKRRGQADASAVIAAHSFGHECALQMRIILPLIIANISEIFPQLIAMSMVGNLPNDSADKLSAVAMARSFANVTGLAVAWGMTSGLYTLVPQSIGAQAWDKLTLSSQRAFVVSHAVLVPLIILQWFLGDILVAIGLPSKMCRMVGLFCKLYIPNMVFVVWLTILQRIAQGFEYNNIQVVFGVIINVFMYGVCYVLVNLTQLDYLGCAIALDLTMLLNALLVALYLVWKGKGYIFIPQRWSDIQRGLHEYWSLSWPGVFSSSAEWIASEVVTICAGYMRHPSVAVSVVGIGNSLFGLLIVQTFAISTAVQVRVGKLIGSGLVSASQRTVWAGLFIQFWDSSLFLIICLVFRIEIMRLFSNDDDVVRIGELLMFVLSVGTLTSGWEQCIFAAFKGLGYPKECSWVMSISYYLFSIPLMTILLFVVKLRRYTALGSLVAFSSMVLAQGLAALFMSLMLALRIDWNQAADAASQRNREILLVQSVLPSDSESQSQKKQNIRKGSSTREYFVNDYGSNIQNMNDSIN